MRARFTFLAVTFRAIPSHSDTLLAMEWTLNREVFGMIQKRYPNLEVDMFAMRYNNQLPLFVSPFPDPLALGTYGRSLDWESRDMYAFSLSLLIP